MRWAIHDVTIRGFILLQMRYIKKIGVWPVGLVGTLPYEGPVVKNGKVHSWFSGFLRTSREYPIDMAGFAFTGKFLLQHPQAMFQFNDQPGVMENDFLATMNIKKEDFEPKADNCTKVRKLLSNRNHPQY